MGTGLSGSVTGGGDISTSAISNSGVNSGTVNISASNDVALTGTIDTDGASNTALNGSNAGTVTVTTNNGDISVGGIDARGGATTSGPSGGLGKTISLQAGGTGSTTTVTGDLRARGGSNGTGPQWILPHSSLKNGHATGPCRWFRYR